MPFFSYRFASAESITKTFNVYTGTGDSWPRTQSAAPTDLAEAVWFNSAYAGPGVSGSTGGGGISIFSGGA